jgi:hypothetical protein
MHTSQTRGSGDWLAFRQLNHIDGPGALHDIPGQLREPAGPRGQLKMLKPSSMLAPERKRGQRQAEDRDDD